jgi:hypothetical protein
VALASRGQRDLDTGPEAITDAAELVQVLRQARNVHMKSLVLAAALVALALMIPTWR